MATESGSRNALENDKNIESGSLRPEAQRLRTQHDEGISAMTPNQIAEAYRASVSEHRMKLSEATQTYKKALLWSAVMGMVS